MNIEEAYNTIKKSVEAINTRPYATKAEYEKVECIKVLLTAYEQEKEKNKELEEKIIHRYKRICPECNNSFIAKRNNTKYCQKCSKKVARRKYKEANKEKIREYSKLHMRKYRAKKKLLKEE